MAEETDPVARHTFTKERQPQTKLELSYHQPNSHPSKIRLRVILNRLKAKAETLLAEEQAGFIPGRSTAEQIFNSRVIIEKHLQHQRDLFHNFIDLKKAFDRVKRACLWQVLRSFNVKEGLVQAIQARYENSNSAVLLNSQLGQLFKKTVAVRLTSFPTWSTRPTTGCRARSTSLWVHRILF